MSKNIVFIDRLEPCVTQPGNKNKNQKKDGRIFLHNK